MIPELKQDALDMIKSFEGLRLTAYKAAKGEQYLTIGYGHYGSDVTPGMSISAARAEELLKQDLAAAKRAVLKYHDKYSWSDNEFGALVSFAYNVGSIDQLTQNGTRTKEQICAKITAYNRSGGVILPGLTRRREAEQKLFKTR